MEETAQDLYDQARTALAEHRTGEAGVLLGRALAVCDPDELDLRVRVQVSTSWVVFEDEGLQPALRALIRPRSAARRAGRHDLVASCAVQIGTLHARAGDLPAAWRALRNVHDDDLSPPDRMRMLLNRGTIASELRRFGDAVRDLTRTAELADQLDVAPIEFMARHNLGWVQFLRSDLPAALQAMHDANELPVDLDRSVAQLDRARVLLEAGLCRDARELLLLARADQHSGQQIAEVDLDLARCALLAGELDEAWQRAHQAAGTFSQRGEPAWHRRAALIALLARPTMSDAEALWDEASATGDHWVGPHAAAVVLGATSNGSPAAAEIVAATRQLARSPILSRRLAGLLALAQSAAAAGDHARARLLLRRASQSLLQGQMGLASLDLRSAAALHGEAAAALDLDIAARGAGSRRADAMIQSSERWRAATRPTPKVRPATDPRVATAASQLRRLRAELPSGGGGSADALRAVTAAERELRSLTWGARTPVPPTATTLSTAALRRAAAEAGVTLVVALRRGDELSAAVVTPDQTRLVCLGSATTVSSLVELVHADLTARASLGPGHPMAAVVQASLVARLDALAEAVVSPLGEVDGPVVVVPSRILAGVPWLALPPWRGRPVTVAPTAASWALGGRVVRHPRVSVLTGPDLPCAALEAATVSACWPAASSAGLVEALGRDDLVHVAAHGEHRHGNPLFSSLRLAEGQVVAHELEGVPLRASHVVLSACEVGRSTHRPGDQPLGLTATLLSSGVACVVAPVAPVSDELAAQVMGDYHAALSGGADAATALARATSGDAAAGAFTCFGAPWRAVS